jgi:V8-like Glu-specific endopeptidase
MSNMKRMGLLSITVFLGACGAGADDRDEVASDGQKITGGMLVTANVPPFDSAVRILGLQPCSGSKIGARRFLTAGHCVKGLTSGSSISLTNGLDGTFGPGSTFTIDRLYVHPSYELTGSEHTAYDVAVFDITADTPWIPVLTIDPNYFAPGTTGLAIGYGCDKTNPSHGGKKQWANMTAISLADYQTSAPLDPESQAGEYAHTVISKSTTVQLCPGDSGGPLLRQNNGVWQIAAVNDYWGTGFGWLFSFQQRAGDIRQWIGAPIENFFFWGVSGTFINVNSAKCIGVDHASTADDANLDQFFCDGRLQTADNQFWTLGPVGFSSLFTIRNGKSGKCIGVDHASTASGARVAQYPCDGFDNQSWQFFQASPGRFNIVNGKSGKCIGVDRAATANGAELFQFTCDGSMNQQWIFSL